jgi:predicted phosphodiesterase
MKILVISDIHANLTALEAVLQDAGTVDGVWCLGDIVGYGPDPNECVERVQGLPNLTCLLGNHDAAALNRIPTETFNSDARRSIEWMQAVLTESSVQFLASLPESTSIENVTLVHGSPRNPVWEYILDLNSARENMNYLKTDYCMVGHTHIPVAYFENPETHQLNWMAPPLNKRIELHPHTIINPGSVGQPRDHGPRSSYAFFFPETSQWELHRVTYDIRAVQQRIRDAALPIRHALRLVDGW